MKRHIAIQLAEETERPITEEEIKEAVPLAIAKLNWIIEREGDANGERLKPHYLEQLIMEQVLQMRFSSYTQTQYKEKRNVAYANAPQ